MKILVTGGTGIIGQGVIPALLDAGHSIRILSRKAEEESKQWIGNIEPFAADVSDAASLQNAADDCDAVVHIAGIVQESLPEQTFSKVNVQGTANILAEAARGNVRRFIFVSSLGSETGTSDYHQSKKAAEELVQQFSREWIILRPSTIYGPGDEVISKLLTMVRTLPAMPIIDLGNDRFQPVWYEDFGKVVARSVEMQGIENRIFELGGSEVTTMSDVVNHLETITGRTLVKIPLPSFVAELAAEVAEKAEIPFPIDESKLKMLKEENFVSEDGRSALTDVFSITPISLHQSLKILADSLPENTPETGVGEMQEKRFWVEIQDSKLNARELLQQFRLQFSEMVPLDFSAEPGTRKKIRVGTTLTASLPMRGHIQIRLEELTPHQLTFLTLEGHPLAGVLRFSAENVRKLKLVRFTILIQSRAANFFDFLAMKTVGETAQNLNWKEVLRRVIRLSGGEAPKGVHEFSQVLSDQEAESIEAEAKELILSHST
jgi:uncharacterized protein YbjT (DUF2867 family)